MLYITVMYKNMEVGRVVSSPDNPHYCIFRYSDDFIKTGIELCPLIMPLNKTNYIFTNLDIESFKGLPPLLADSLPDRYGSELLFLWKKLNSKESLTSLEALSYIGKRGMGALEFVPSFDKIGLSEKDAIEIEQLVEVAKRVLNYRETTSFNSKDANLKQLISVGSSIGGARAKAILAINKNTGEIKSGQLSGLVGFEYCIVKFDGLSKDLSEDNNVTYYTRIEYAYYLMAKEAGISISDSSILKINDKYHFKTKRFDRTDNGEKIHMLSLAGLKGFDYRKPGNNSYEEVADIIYSLGCDKEDIYQLFKRMVFNVVSKNNDDHIKNISFLMDDNNQFRLSPAYDLSYSYNPNGDWTKHHQMKVNGKIDDITYDDLLESAKNMNISEHKAKELISNVINAAKKFPKFALEADLPNNIIDAIYGDFVLLEEV